MKVLAVVGDLMFRSRVEAILNRLQIPVVAVSVRDAADAVTRVDPTHIVVNLAEVDAAGLALLAGSGRPLFGFGPHVDRERFLGGRRLGATVVANSAMEPRLQAWLGQPGQKA